ncbi:AAA family ATPase [Streptomyces sp. NPDC055078]
MGARERRVPAFAEELTGTLGVHSQYVLHGNIRDIQLVRHDPAPDEGVGKEPQDAHHTLTEVLWNTLKPEGYQALIRYDIVDGFTVPAGSAAQEIRELLHTRADAPRIPHPARAEPAAQLTDAAATLRSIVTGWQQQLARKADNRLRGGVPGPVEPYRVVLLIDYAARIPTDIGRLSDPERDFFLGCLKLAEDAKPMPAPDGGRPRFNPVIWLADGERELPSWLVAGSERVRTIGIPLPDLGARRRMARLLAKDHSPAPTGEPEDSTGEGAAAASGPRLDKSPAGRGWESRGSEGSGPDGRGSEGRGRDGRSSDGRGPDGGEGPAVRLDKSLAGADGSPSGAATAGEDDIDAFARATAGLTLRAMRESAHIARSRDMPFAAMRDAVRVYRLGVEDNPWRRSEIRRQITRGESFIRDRVRGQDRAVGMTLDILKRAALGLSGAQASHPGSRPRGVLFFAGATGTGKTELAKSVATVLFGNQDALLRFDMSEFSAEHSVDRLVGAPPGYVGYEAGGELTSAVRNDPFRVVLFDEIDKAHIRVLDKFLQVLEDGRLTDGQGVTTYFSECVLIFTSNLGVRSREGGAGRVAALGMPYHELKEIIEENVTHFFVHEIGRPELKNRLGGNIVVFDYISPTVAAEIFDSQVGNIQRLLEQELGVHLRLSDEAHRVLSTHCTANLENGGRGIGMDLETYLINPLARELFDRDTRPGTAVTVTGVRLDLAGTAALDLRVTTPAVGHPRSGHTR